MKLATDWKCVLQRAWSIRLMLLAGVFSGLEIALPLIDGLYPIPAGVFAAASGLTTCAAFVSRLLAQKTLGDRT